MVREGGGGGGDILWWQIVPAILDKLMRDENTARSKKVTDALLKMVKLDIAALEKAHRS